MILLIINKKCKVGHKTYYTINKNNNIIDYITIIKKNIILFIQQKTTERIVTISLTSSDRKRSHFLWYDSIFITHKSL